MNRSLMTTCLTFLAASASALAGPMAPPVGPVNSTMKPLNEVEPRIAISAANTPGSFTSLYKISQPGSYYLTGNVTGAIGKSGIEIAASGVTLDLNGFQLLGVAGSDSGVLVSGTVKCVVKNGTVRGWSDYGVYVNSPGCKVFEVAATENGVSGFLVGTDGELVDCLASGNLQSGITTGSSCILTRCTAVSNGTTTAHNGINASDRCVVTNCTARDNSGYGIKVGHGGRVADSTAYDNYLGIFTYSSGLVTGCVTQLNTTDGINAGAGTMVRNCQSNSNSDDGIQVADNCVVMGNNCQGNGPSAAGAGVYAPASNCRIEDNFLVSNAYGVLISQSGTNNFVVKNTARNNGGSNFSFPANNDVAPVINNPDVSFSGSITPWSNFAF